MKRGTARSIAYEGPENTRVQMAKAVHASRGSYLQSCTSMGISQVHISKISKRFFFFLISLQKGLFAQSAAKLGISAETAKFLRGKFTWGNLS